MNLNIWYGMLPAKFHYYEDDGTTYDYLKGIFYSRVIEFNPENREITLNSVQGKYSGKFHSVELILHGFPSGLQVSINGKSAKTEGTGTIQTITFPNETGKISLNW